MSDQGQSLLAQLAAMNIKPEPTLAPTASPTAPISLNLSPPQSLQQPQETAQSDTDTSAIPNGTNRVQDTQTPPNNLGKTTPEPSFANMSFADDSAQSAPQQQADSNQFVFPTQPDKMHQDIVNHLSQALYQLQGSLGQREMVGNALVNIMGLLRQHPFLADVMRDEDCGMMIRALRESYGTTVAKKRERSTKRTAKAQKVEKDVNEMMTALQGIEFNIGM